MKIDEIAKALAESKNGITIALILLMGWLIYSCNQSTEKMVESNRIMNERMLNTTTHVIRENTQQSKKNQEVLTELKTIIKERLR